MKVRVEEEVARDEHPQLLPRPAQESTLHICCTRQQQTGWTLWVVLSGVRKGASHICSEEPVPVVRDGLCKRLPVPKPLPQLDPVSSAADRTKRGQHLP
jgi:hypothetical protein